MSRMDDEAVLPRVIATPLHKPPDDSKPRCDDCGRSIYTIVIRDIGTGRVNCWACNEKRARDEA